MCVHSLINSGDCLRFKHDPVDAAGLTVTRLMVFFFVEGIHSFIHPGMCTLIVGKHSIEPVMTYLVCDGEVQFFLVFCGRDYCDRWVLHSSAETLRPLYNAYYIVRIFAEQGRIMMNGGLGSRKVVFPGIAVFRSVEIENADHSSGSKFASVVIHCETLVGKPGEIMHHLLCEAKRLDLCRRRWEEVVDSLVASSFLFHLSLHWFPEII